jgi:Domain of unknown function (DUF4429)/Short C-terminal domain
MRLFGSNKDKQEQAKPMLMLDDRKNSVELWPNKITIRRHGLMNAMNVGLTGDKDIYLNTITGIQIKKPGMTTGYIQFMARGSQDSKSGVTGAVKDENTVIFSGKKNHQIAQELKAKIEELLHQPLPSSSPPVSAADELIKLASLRDQGILTNSEFEEQKKVLLGNTN